MLLAFDRLNASMAAVPGTVETRNKKTATVPRPDDDVITPRTAKPKPAKAMKNVLATKRMMLLAFDCLNASMDAIPRTAETRKKKTAKLPSSSPRSDDDVITPRTTKPTPAKATHAVLATRRIPA